jgi:hypothetical protein
MKPPDYPFDRCGEIVLDPILGNAMFLIPACTETFEKSAPIIPEDVGLDQQDTGDISLDDGHIKAKN